MTGTTTALLDGLAGLIVSRLPGYGYAPDQPLDADAATVPLVQVFTPDAPDRVVTLHALPVTDHPSLPMGMVLVQVKARGRRGFPVDPSDDLDAIFGVLHGLMNLELPGGIAIVQCLRQVRAPLGLDANDRLEAADHFEVWLDYPSTEPRPDGGAW